MEPVTRNRTVLRLIAHAVVYGVCSLYMGITPPPEEQEVKFLAFLVGVVIVMAAAATLFGWYLARTIFKY